MNKETIEKLESAFKEFIDIGEKNESFPDPTRFTDFINPFFQDKDIPEYPCIDERELKLLNMFLIHKYGISPLTKEEVNDYAYYFFNLLDICGWKQGG